MIHIHGYVDKLCSIAFHTKLENYGKLILLIMSRKWVIYLMGIQLEYKGNAGNVRTLLHNS